MSDKDNSARSEKEQSRKEISRPAARKATLVESDYRETRMDYGHGKLPLYVAAAWGLLLLGYVSYMVVYAAPDLSIWGMP